MPPLPVEGKCLILYAHPVYNRCPPSRFPPAPSPSTLPTCSHMDPSVSLELRSLHPPGSLGLFHSVKTATSFFLHIFTC